MKKIAGIFAASVAAFLIIAVPAFAIVKADDVIIVKQDETINDDIFVAGDEIVIEGRVNGDVYAAGNRVAIRGIVSGDVIAAAQTIEISGEVRDDVRAVGNTMSLVGGQVGDSVNFGGNELSVDSESSIDGGVVFGGRLLSIDGSVGRGVMSGGESVRINGAVGNTVRTAATDITIGDDAVIGGDFEYSSENEATISGVIQGETNRSENDYSVDTEGILQALSIGFTVWAFVGVSLVAGVMILLFPNLFKKGTAAVQSKPWRIVGFGAVALFATVPVLVFLLVSVVGIPLALVVLVLWVVALYLAKIFTAHAIGKLLVEFVQKTTESSRWHMFFYTIIGLIIYYIARMIPYLGGLIRLAVTVVGLGIMAHLFVEAQSKSVKKRSSK